MGAIPPLEQRVDEAPVEVQTALVHRPVPSGRIRLQEMLKR